MTQINQDYKLGSTQSGGSNRHIYNPSERKIYTTKACTLSHKPLGGLLDYKLTANDS